MTPTIETKIGKNPNVIAKLQERANTSKVFAAMANVFASRERTRNQITIQSLQVTMQKEGYDYTRMDYIKELDFLSTLEIGTLTKSKSGVLKALTNINVTLQSVGAAALGKKVFLDKARAVQHHKRTALPPPPPPPLAMPMTMPSLKKELDRATLIVTLDGRRMKLDLSPKITTNELLNLIFNLAAVGVSDAN